ncbi:MAG: DUF4292 domain-containing protein [Prolixibacteraceae bacterium]|jgi:hypothetical protein|nr:DUF4292 domain-containing protein [Prolixibacteraceae bacterium]
MLNNITIKNFVFIVVTLWIFSSCSTSKTFTNHDIKPLTAGKILRKVSRETPNYKTYESKKISINYENNKTKTTFSGQFKLNKDDCIILTLKKLSMPLGRGYITTDSVFFVNYFEKYFIEENIETMQTIFGIDVDFNLLQALLTADVSSLLQNKELDKDLSSFIDENMYRIDSKFTPKIDRALSKGNNKKMDRYMKKMDDSEFIDYTVWIDPEYFVIRKISFKDIKYKNELTLQFDQYELVGRSLFPQQIELSFRTPKQKMKIEMKLSRPSVNKVTDFNFNIPDKYEKFKISKK